jgi:hypothetical protein
MKANQGTERGCCWMSREESKPARLVQSDNYRLTKHILSTTNIVERLFSLAKLALTDHRKHMTPRHPELLMFLRTTRSLWNWKLLLPRVIINAHACLMLGISRSSSFQLIASN